MSSIVVVRAKEKILIDTLVDNGHEIKNGQFIRDLSIKYYQ